MIPSLLRSRPFGSANRTKCRPWMRTPRRCTPRNSLRRRIRSSRERFRSTSARPPRFTGRPGVRSSILNSSGRALRATDLPRSTPRRPLGNRKALPPLGPAPPQDFPAGLRAHALAESVGPLAPPVVRLIRAFHALIPATRLGGHTRRETNMVATAPDGCQRNRSPRAVLHAVVIRLSSSG